jgi:hypothetical protein
LLNQPFHPFSDRSRRIGLLKERMRCLERRGEVNDAPRVLRDSLECGFDRIRRRDPHHEYRIDLLQAGVETLGNREIPAHDVDVCRQTRCVRIASHRTTPGASSSQLIDDVTPDVSSGAGDQDSIHR